MLLQNLRAKIGARLNGDQESGFTLIELLVVMLILGILAAIALPAFFNQKEKAGDAKAKENAHTAQVAIETWATDHNGAYTGATAATLKTIEPTIKAAVVDPEAETTGEGIIVTKANADEYTIESWSSNERKFVVENVKGTLTYPCAPVGGGCTATGWGG